MTYENKSEDADHVHENLTTATESHGVDCDERLWRLLVGKGGQIRYTE